MLPRELRVRALPPQRRARTAVHLFTCTTRAWPVFVRVSSSPRTNCSATRMVSVCRSPFAPSVLVRYEHWVPSTTWPPAGSRVIRSWPAPSAPSFGYVFGEVKQVLSYYFGSTDGSARKTELIAMAAPTVEPNPSPGRGRVRSLNRLRATSLARTLARRDPWRTPVQTPCWSTYSRHEP